MKITLEPTIDIDDIQEEMGTKDFPFMQMAENGSYATVSLDGMTLSDCREDIEAYSHYGDVVRMRRLINLRDFIIKMNALGYYDHILVYIHW